MLREATDRVGQLLDPCPFRLTRTATGGAQLRSGAGGEVLLWAMRHWPEAAGRILETVATGRPWRPFPWGSLLRPRLAVPADPGP